MTLSDVRTLGRSGLPVSPLALGAMTFGNTKWGSDDAGSAGVFDAYVAAGGNFIDTADVYSGGRSEELVGRLVAERTLRDKLVVATKWSFSGGNGRKNMHRALEGSLRRLGMDYIDLYWMHVWDRVTPAEEVLQSMVDLVRAGKIRYYGLSDCPAWFAARVATLAQAHNVPGPIALQVVYSLAERTIENEHVPAALATGMGIAPWAPLGAGFLTGKYTRDADGQPVSAAEGQAGGRLDAPGQKFRRFTDRDWRVLDELRAVAAEVSRPMAEVALAWVLARPAVASVLIGASTVPQVASNLRSLDVVLSTEQTARLTRAGDAEPGNFYSLFGDQVNRGIFGGSRVEGWTGK